jgi:uncharacterized radical SAM superfamily Fe-S cluster-containing enzyme
MCSVCFASSGGLNSTHRDFELLKKDLKIIKAQAPRVVLQLSGGEPSLHPNLIELVYEAASIFPGVQLNTNGLNLAKDKSLARELKKAGLKWVFLQFDSLNDEVYRLLRGRALVETKLKALENLEAAKLPAVLVPTVVRGLNHGELGELIRLAASKAWLRGVHFQPMTASGRNSFLGPQYRLTLPELLTLLQEQGCGTIDIDKAFPPGCEHERCSFHLRFRRLNDGTLIPKTALASSNCCSEGANDKSAPLESQDGQSRDRAVDIILRSWAPGQNTEPTPIKPSTPKSFTPKPLIPLYVKKKDAFDEFLENAARETFSLTAMFFQDAWSIDLERLEGCCVHIFAPPDRFVPFCAMNLTSADGQALHRGHRETLEP